MSEILWEKEVKRVYTEKGLRLLLQRFFREKLRGLPPHFRLEVKICTLRPKKAAIKIPAHSEGNPIRVAQVDSLIAQLEDLGLEIEVFYLDDFWEEKYWCPREDSNPQPTA